RNGYGSGRSRGLQQVGGEVVSDSYIQYRDFMKALYVPDETVCLAALRNGLSPKHLFVKGENAFTRKSFESLKAENETYDIYLAMNPFKPELIGEKTGRTK